MKPGVVISSGLINWARNLTNKLLEEELIMSLAIWWKGARGEWYVVAQMVLITLVFFGPRAWWGWGKWVFPFLLFLELERGSEPGACSITSSFAFLVSAFVSLPS
jgi:hypothetical protein